MTSTQDVRVDDWSAAVSPFWGAVIRSALSAEGVMGLMKAGWTTVKVRCLQLRGTALLSNPAAPAAPSAMSLLHTCCAGRHRDAADGPRPKTWFDQIQSNHWYSAKEMTVCLSRQVCALPVQIPHQNSWKHGMLAGDASAYQN